MGQTLQKWVTLLEIGHIFKNWVTLKYGSQLTKLVTYGIMSHGLQQMGHTYQKGSQLGILVTLGKMGHIWPNGSH